MDAEYRMKMIQQKTANADTERRLATIAEAERQQQIMIAAEKKQADMTDWIKRTMQEKGERRHRALPSRERVQPTVTMNEPTTPEKQKQQPPNHKSCKR